MGNIHKRLSNMKQFIGINEENRKKSRKAKRTEPNYWKSSLKKLITEKIICLIEITTKESKKVDFNTLRIRHHLYKCILVVWKIAESIFNGSQEIHGFPWLYVQTDRRHTFILEKIEVRDKERGVIMGCLLHWSQKFFNKVFLFVCLTT